MLAAARGSPETAVSYLRRALREPPDGPRDADVLLELGRAEMATGRPRGPRAPAPRRRRAARDAQRRDGRVAGARARGLLGRQAEAVAAYDRAIAAVGEDEEDAALRLEAEAANAARMIRLDREPIGERLRRAGRPVTGDSVAEEMVWPSWHTTARSTTDPPPRSRRWPGPRCGPAGSRAGPRTRDRSGRCAGADLRRRARACRGSTCTDCWPMGAGTGRSSPSRARRRCARSARSGAAT